MSVISVMVKCIFCKSAINVISDLTKDYKKHLMIEHKIMFDIDHVINRTLLVQHPSMARSKTCDCQLRKADDNIEDLLDSYTDYDDIIIETLRNDIARINEKSSKNALSIIDNRTSNIEEAEKDEEIKSQTKDDDLINDDEDMFDDNEDVVNTDEEVISKPQNMVGINEDMIDNDGEKISEKPEDVIIRDMDVINKGETCVIRDKEVNNGDEDTRVENIINEDEDKITKDENKDSANIIDKADVNKEIVHGNQIVDNYMEIVNEINEDIKIDDIIEFDSSFFCTTVQSKLMKNNQSDVGVVRRSTRSSKLKDEGISGDYQIEDKVGANIIDKADVNKEIVHGNQIVDNHMEIVNEINEDIKINDIIEFDSSLFCKNKQTDVSVVRRSTRISKLKDEGISPDYQIVDHDKPIKIKSEKGEIFNLNETDSVVTSMSPMQLPWYYGCLYTCEECPKQFVDRHEFIEHIKIVHSITFEKYVASYTSEKIVKNQHECEECGMGVAWYKTNLEKHLEMHEMRMDEYYDKYKSEFEIPILKISDPSLLQKLVTLNPSTNVSTNTGYDSSWTNRCVYLCKLCEKSFDSRRKFDVHVVSEHKISMSKYSNKYGRTMLHEEKHHCQIKDCNSKVLWEKMSILQHLKKSHSLMTLQNYEKSYMENYVEKEDTEYMENSWANNSWANRCIYKCKICEVTKKSKHSFRVHINSQHKVSLKEYSKEHGTTMEHKETHHCQMENCQSIILWDASRIYQHLHLKHKNSISLEKYCSQFMSSYNEKKNCTDTEVTSSSESDSVSLWNKNEYKCRLENCQFSCTGRNKLKGHLSKDHKILNVADYFKTHKNSRTTNEYHICQMCGVSVVWDLLPMQSHIYQSHRLTLESYRSTYMDDYSKQNKIDKNNIDEPEESEQVIKWSAGSLLWCKLCDDKIVGMYQFTKHLGSQHNFSFNKYEKSYKDFTLHTGYHFCKKCGKNVKHDLQFLKAHMAEHDMSLEKYFNEFNPRMPKVIRIVDKYGY